MLNNLKKLFCEVKPSLVTCEQCSHKVQKLILANAKDILDNYWDYRCSAHGKPKINYVTGRLEDISHLPLCSDVNKSGNCAFWEQRAWPFM